MSLKLVSHLLEIVALLQQIVNHRLLKMYSKFVLPNRTLFGRMGQRLTCNKPLF